MQNTIFLCLILFSANAFCTQSVLLGEKVSLSPHGPYHFSSKDLIKVFLNSSKPFFIGQNIGELDYIENKDKKTVFILNAEQNAFFKRFHPVVKDSLNLKWQLKNQVLILKGSNVNSNLIKYALKACEGFNGQHINLSFAPMPAPNDSTCLNNLGAPPEKQIQIVIINKSKVRGSKFGAGVPSQLDWLLQTNNKVSFDNVRGRALAHNNSLNLKNTAFFEGALSLNRPLVFESGSEVGLQAGGVFSRQAIDWQKATTSIEVKLKDTSLNNSEINLILNKKSRTGEAQVFQIEKINKNFLITNNQWKKAVSFSSKEKDISKNKFLGLFILGSKTHAQSRMQKEIWIKVSNSDQ